MIYDRPSHKNVPQFDVPVNDRRGIIDMQSAISDHTHSITYPHIVNNYDYLLQFSVSNTIVFEFYAVFCQNY